jgi:hypothetical protein
MIYYDWLERRGPTSQGDSFNCPCIHHWGLWGFQDIYGHRRQAGRNVEKGRRKSGEGGLAEEEQLTVGPGVFFNPILTFGGDCLRFYLYPIYLFFSWTCGGATPALERNEKNSDLRGLHNAENLSLDSA